MVASQVHSIRTRSAFRLLVGTGTLVIALVGCKAASSSSGSGGTNDEGGSNGKGGSGGVAVGGSDGSGAAGSQGAG